MLLEFPEIETPKFVMGQRVRKKSGSDWHGRVVGMYSTVLTQEGYAVESERERGSVQIYPAVALMANDVDQDHCGDAIVEAVRTRLAERSRAGQAKYGTTLLREDLDTLDWIRHSQEETLDTAVYLERLYRDLEKMISDWR